MHLPPDAHSTKTPFAPHVPRSVETASDNHPGGLRGWNASLCPVRADGHYRLLGECTRLLGECTVGAARVPEPDEGAVRQGTDSVERGDRRQLGEEVPARVVRAGGDLLVDVLDGDGLHIDDDLALAGDGIREVLVPRDAADLVQHRRLHPSSWPKKSAIRRCHAASTRGGRADEWFHEPFCDRSRAAV